MGWEGRAGRLWSDFACSQLCFGDAAWSTVQVNVGHCASFEVGGRKLTVLKAETSNSLLKDLGKEKTTFTKVTK